MIFPVSYVLLDLFSAVLKLGKLDRQGGIQFLIVDCMLASTVSDSLVGAYFYETAVDDVNYSVDCNACFRDIGCYYDFSFSFLCWLKYGLLFLSW